jgi:fucose permease
MIATQTQKTDISASRMAIAVVYLGFALSGVVTVVLGPLLPILIARWSMTDESAGLFFTSQFCGNLLGSISIGRLISRRGYGLTIGIGFALIAVGIAALGLERRPLGLLATVVFGYGLGLVLSGTNLWVGEVAGARRAAALTISNLAWGIGAILCPLLVLLAERSNRIGMFLFGLAGLSALFAVVLVSMAIEPPQSTRATESVVRDASPFDLKRAIPLGALFFLYCGTESAIGGWSAAYARRGGAGPTGVWELAPMFLWAGLLAGRALGPLIFRVMAERKILILGLSLAALCNAALLSFANLRGAAICLVGIGLGFACVFPLLVASLVGDFGKRASQVASVLFPLASVGGATIPWLVGFTSTHLGGLRAGLMVPLAVCVLMLALVCLVPRQPLTQDKLA